MFAGSRALRALPVRLVARALGDAGRRRRAKPSSPPSTALGRHPIVAADLMLILATIRHRHVVSTAAMAMQTFDSFQVTILCRASRRS
jgi:hypothetical protein